eukprot:9980318-Alexandrium_andersonii.AAC.1
MRATCNLQPAPGTYTPVHAGMFVLAHIHIDAYARVSMHHTGTHTQLHMRTHARTFAQTNTLTSAPPL